MLLKILNYLEKLATQGNCPHSSRSTEFRAMKVFDAVAQGKLSYKDYSRLKTRDLATAITCLDCGKQWFSP